MHGKPGQDYLADFATIGAKPGCSPAELEAAWRRRVSDLHPDRARPGAPAGDDERREVLSEINGAYRRLRHFQRRHGRMPGSAPASGVAGGTDRERDPEHEAWRRPTSRAWLIALFNAALLGLVAVLVWVLLEHLGIRDHDGPGGGADAAQCAPGTERQCNALVHHRAPFRNSTTSTVCSSTSRSNTRLWFLT